MHINTAIRRVKKLAKEFSDSDTWEITRNWSNFSPTWEAYVGTEKGTFAKGRTLETTIKRLENKLRGLNEN